MRSRYSAFYQNNADYLINTLHPSKRSETDREDLEKNFSDCRWIKLEVRKTLKGKPGDEEGEVEFIAYLMQKDVLSQLHERSRFVYEDNQWFYLDGEIYDTPERITLPLGRNEPCWCGSGKKYKHCHG